MMDGERWIVWKCFVLPGVDETDTFLAPSRALMVLDFPTLGYPTSPTFSFGVVPPGGVNTVEQYGYHCFSFNKSEGRRGNNETHILDPAQNSRKDSRALTR